MSRTVSTTWTRGRKTVQAGDALAVKGLPGQVRFRMHVRLDDGREWLEVVHPTLGFYAVWLNRVKAVPRKSTLRPLAGQAVAS